MNPRQFISAIALIAILGAGYFFLVQNRESVQRDEQATSMPNTPTPSQPQQQTYSNAKYGISFSYPESYELLEIDSPGSALREHHIITLMRKADLPPPQGGEGPPAIAIEMYQNNLDHQTTEGWIRGTSNSNFKLGDMTLASTTISGMPALSYRWSGLYEGTSIAMAQDAWVYVFSVTYLEPGADIVQDFVQIRESVRITPAAIE